MTKSNIEAKVARLIDAVEWIANNHSVDDSQRHDLLAELHGPEWAAKNPVFERKDGG